MRLIKDKSSGAATAAGADIETRIDRSICYDFVVSLRALFNPRTYTQSRRWAAAQLPRLGPEVAAKGQFLFGDFDTALGYCAVRLIHRLPEGSGPRDLVDTVGSIDAAELAMFMLDTGETTRQQLELFRAVLNGDSSTTDAALEGLPEGWATRCRRVLRNPAAVKADLVEVLDTYHSEIYSKHTSVVFEAIEASVPAALETLELRPPLEAVEHLTGGYTFSPTLGLRTITLAASVFIYPFMSARIDEATGHALIIYGVTSDVLDGYEPTPQPTALVAQLRAVADPNRLTILRLLVEQPMYTSDVIRQLGLSQTTIHHHLAQLRSAGLVRQQRDRKGMEYSIRTEALLEVLRSLEEWVLGAGESTD